MKLVLFLACLYFTSTVSARPLDVRIGGRAGLTFSNFAFDPEPDGDVEWERAMGFALGGELNFWIAPQFGIAAQLLYVTRASRAENEIGTIKLTQTINTSYLEVPIYGKLQFGEGQVRPYVFAGPALGLLLSARTKIKSGNNENEEEVSDEFASTDLGLHGGLGISFNVDERTSLIGDAGYHFGLTDLDDESGSFSVMHRGFRIMGGILIKI